MCQSEQVLGYTAADMDQDDGEEAVCVGSIAELEELTGEKG